MNVINQQALDTVEPLIRAPLVYKGKVRELYDLGEHWLIAVTDRISAFDVVLRPPIPGKGAVLNRLSAYWFERTAHLQENHMVHADAARLVREGVVEEKDLPLVDGRLMVCRKAERIDMECIVRGYLSGGGWRQYEKTGAVNGIRLPEGLRKNDRLPEPVFTPSAKNDTGHDEDIPFAEMERRIGKRLAAELQSRSLALYRFGREWCWRRGIVLADCKMEFGLIGGEIVLIDELFTPDSARFWAAENYRAGADIDSMDKEPVRRYLAASGGADIGADPLPDQVVQDTARRYETIYRRITQSDK
jgi:phosphoribosylaminoimidazole-succinocarboxamide synthase